MPDQHVPPVTAEDWAKLRGQLMATNLALKVALAVIAQDEPRARSLQNILERIQDGRLDWYTNSELGEPFKKAFDETIRQYTEFAHA